MKELNNKTLRDISYEEHKALLEACNILEKGFKKRVYAVNINPNERQRDDVFGISISFDQFEHTRG